MVLSIAVGIGLLLLICGLLADPKPAMTVVGVGGAMVGLYMGLRLVPTEAWAVLGVLFFFLLVYAVRKLRAHEKRVERVADAAYDAALKARAKKDADFTVFVSETLERQRQREAQK